MSEDDTDRSMSHTASPTVSLICGLMYWLKDYRTGRRARCTLEGLGLKGRANNVTNETNDQNQKNFTM